MDGQRGRPHDTCPVAILPNAQVQRSVGSILSPKNCSIRSTIGASSIWRSSCTCASKRKVFVNCCRHTQLVFQNHQWSTNLNWSLVRRCWQICCSRGPSRCTLLLPLRSRADVNKVAFRFLVYKSSHYTKVKVIEFLNVEARRGDEIRLFEESSYLYLEQRSGPSQ